LLDDSTPFKEILKSPEFNLLPTKGGIYADGTGMGKTMTVLLFLGWVVRFDELAYTNMEAEKVTLSQEGGRTYEPRLYRHRPHLILAPSANVLI
jgi:hypothetical protein